MDQLELYKLWSTRVRLTSVTAFHPDVGPPESPFIDFVLRIELGHVMLVCDGEQICRRLENQVNAALFEDARQAAAAGNGSSGPDTAIGRSITSLELDVIEAKPGEPPGRAVYNLNHCAPSSRGPLSWRRFLEHVGPLLDLPSFQTKLAWVLPWFGHGDVAP